MTALGDLLVEQLPKFDHKRNRLAKAIGLTASRLTRVIKGEYSLDVANCLRLALAADLHPSTVLRTAGKQDVADLIERLYGPGKDALTAAQREVLDLWTEVDSAKVRQAVVLTMRAHLEDREGRGGPPSRPAAPPATTHAARRGRARTKGSAK